MLLIPVLLAGRVFALHTRDGDHHHQRDHVPRDADDRRLRTFLLQQSADRLVADAPKTSGDNGAAPAGGAPPNQAAEAAMRR